MNRTTAIASTVITVLVFAAAGIIVMNFAPRRSERTNPPITPTQFERKQPGKAARAPATTQKPGTRIFAFKAITTSESLVRSMREDTPVVLDSNNEPISYATLDFASRLKFEGAVRGLARDLLPDDRQPTRGRIAAAASKPSTREKFDFDFDATTGETRIRVTHPDGVGTLVFNAYQLGASAAAGKTYSAPGVPPLPIDEP